MAGFQKYTTLTKLTYQRKYQLMLCTIPILIIILYKLAFSSTLQYYKNYDQSRITESQPFISARDWDILAQKEKVMASVVGRIKVSPQVQEGEAMSAISSITKDEGVRIIELSKPEIYRDSMLTLYTSKITLEGGFASITNALYKIERDLQLGRLSSASYHSFDDYQAREKRLACTFYLQYVLKNPAQ